MLLYPPLLFWLQSYQVKKKGVGLVEQKQVILHEEGKMDDGITFSRSGKLMQLLLYNNTSFATPCV